MLDAAGLAVYCTMAAAIFISIGTGFNNIIVLRLQDLKHKTSIFLSLELLAARIVRSFFIILSLFPVFVVIRLAWSFTLPTR